MPGININTALNTVTFYTSTVNNLIILTVEKTATGIPGIKLLP